MPKNKHFLILNNGNSAHTHTHSHTRTNTKRTQTRKKQKTKTLSSSIIYFFTGNKVLITTGIFSKTPWHLACLCHADMNFCAACGSCFLSCRCGLYGVTGFDQPPRPQSRKGEKHEEGRNHHEIESSKPQFHRLASCLFLTVSSLCKKLMLVGSESNQNSKNHPISS